MRTNWNTQIVGSKVILVPYRKAHVPKYHEWMKSPELLELTGSEPLTLDEEYEMQETWRESEDKCTFIVLSRELYKDGDEIGAMVGDTNIFVQKEEDDDGQTFGEAEIMIAEEGARGKGMGWEAMCLMLRYASQTLKLRAFQAKIKTTNEPSVRMFAKLGFKEVSRSEVFREISFALEVTKEWEGFIAKETEEMVVKEYCHEGIC